MLTGLDISNIQGKQGITAATIAQADVVICRATEGNTLQDPYLFSNFTAAVKAGKKAGAYHYAHPGTTGVEQAQYFIDYVIAQQLTLDFAVLDFEESPLLPDEQWALDFMRHVRDTLNVPVWFYCNGGAIKEHGYKAIRKEFKFWMAGYWLGFTPIQGFNPPMSLDEYIVASGINSVGIDFAGWQFTPVGRLPGFAYDLDLNVFFEDAFTDVVAAITPDAVAVTPLTSPVAAGSRISQDFAQAGTGYNLASGGHTGRDYAVNTGTPVGAVAAGTVLWADWATNLPGDNSNAGWESRWLVHKDFAGITVVIDHGSYLSLYAHLNKTDMNPGDTVAKGQTIGYSGNTGSATTGPHLHWEIVPKPFAYWTNGYYGRVSPGAFVEENNSQLAQIEAAGIDDFWEEIMALYNTKKEFEDALYNSVAKPILDELTPGKAGVKNAGAVFAALYNLNGHLEELKNLFMPGKAGVRSEGNIRALLRSIKEGK